MYGLDITMHETDFGHGFGGYFMEGQAKIRGLMEGGVIIDILMDSN